MDFIEVKHEFESDNRLQCRACLSVGRKLAPLGRFTNIYLKLTAGLDYPSPISMHPIEICWECQSLLRKVVLFQQQVKKAQELLSVGQNFLYGSFSNLASVTLNETQHTIYFSNNNRNNPNLVANDTENTDNVVNYDIVANNNHLLNTDNKANEKIIEQCNLDNENAFKSKKCWPMTHKRRCNAIKKNDVNSYKDPSMDYSKIHKDKSDGDISDNVHKSEMFVGKNKRDGAYSDNNNIFNDKNNKQIFNLNTLISDGHVDDLENNFDEETFTDVNKNDVNMKIEMEAFKQKHSKSNSKSRWALKRAKQNKKPKFKIILTNLNETFTKVQISGDELAEYMAKEVNSEYEKSKRLKCKKGMLGFVDEKDFIKHNKTLHTKDNMIPGCYICDICEKKIDDKRHLSAHISQHYFVQKCTVCQFVCRNKEQKLYHFQREHKKMFQCLKCELKFGNRRIFFKHFKEWHEKFICDYCGVSFKMRYCIKDHIRKQHSPFTCAPCNKTFARYNGLWLHKKLAHSPAASPAYCVECDTSYKDIYRYKWHLCNSAKHTPKKKIRVPCPECDKSFTKKIYMTDHYNLVHLKLYKYRCEQCDKNFIRNAELVKHRRRTHEGILPPKNKICYLCGRGFTTNKILQNHLRTHTGERSKIQEVK